MDTIYLIEIIRTEWLQIIDEYCDEENIPYSSFFYFCPQRLFQNNDELPMGESIESAYFTWKL